MKDAAMTDQPVAAQSAEAVDDSTRPDVGRHPRLRKVGTVLTVLWLLFVIVGQLYIWQIDPKQMGLSIPVLVTYSMLLVTCVVLMNWVLFFSSFRWKVALPLGLLMFLPLGAMIGSVRDVDYTGDMVMDLHFRWEPTQEERLQAYRASTDVKPPVIPDEPQVPAATDEDMPNFRGAHRDGVVSSPPLLQDWRESPPRELWRRPCGGGYASFAAVADYLVTIEQRGEDESVVCYDATTGAERWIYEYPAYFDETAGGPGPRATPTIRASDVFTLGAKGELCCLNLLSGELRWKLNVVEDNGLIASDLPDGLLYPRWAFAGAPLVLDQGTPAESDDLVVVNVGGPAGNGLAAYSTPKGDRVWQGAGIQNVHVDGGCQNYAGYSSPMLLELDGVPQVVIFDGVGVRGCDPATGAEFWFHEFSKEGTDPPDRINVAQPLVIGDNRLFISASYTRGCALLEFSHEGEVWSDPKQIWPEEGETNLKLRCKFSSPVLFERHIYGLDEGVLVCLDPETGNRRWAGGRYGHGQMLLVNEQIFLLSEAGDIVLIDPSPERLQERTRLPVLSPENKTWNPPVLSRGRAFVRNHFEIVGLDLNVTARQPDRPSGSLGAP
jgi:outer membrane protein assembly factor BamB